MSRKQSPDKFTFEISLSVLNHLGRNLYRSFATVLGEAISNSWDADAKKVHIYIAANNSSFVIKDDGSGMSSDDFQNKFLRIGYSKRKRRKTSPGGRPYIGRKGIGKLALLSCAQKISVISKERGGAYIGGVIDNAGLDNAITKDLTPKEYDLGRSRPSAFSKYTGRHGQGTIISFQDIHDGIKNSLKFLKKTVALYFRFSLVDPNIKVFINDEEITHKCLDDLAARTEFLWKINRMVDPYVEGMESKGKLKEVHKLKVKGGIKGFVGSVEKPRDLKIINTDERVGVDLFVNGRLRERDLLRHIPTARIAESYLYGQIHVDALDDKKDRFTSSREGVVADDPKFQQILSSLKESVISKILKQWDAYRRKHREDGDSENKSISKKERKAGELFNAVSGDFSLPKTSKNKKEVDGWVSDLAEDAQYNFSSYAECFISENLVRRYIKKVKKPLGKEAKGEVKTYKGREKESKGKGNISIQIRKDDADTSYLSMDALANLVDKKNPTKEACLSRDAKQYKPIRDAIAHTALLTDTAKLKLTSVYANIGARIRNLLSGKKP